jgi:hypothetical protein
VISSSLEGAMSMKSVPMHLFCIAVLHLFYGERPAAVHPILLHQLTRNS